MKNQTLLFPLLVLLTCFLACNKTAPPLPVSESEAAKTALQAILKTENASFSPKLNVLEDENAQVTILKAYNEGDSISATSEQLKAGILLGVFTVRDKKSKQSNTYKSVLTKDGNNTFLKITDLASKKEESIAFASNKDIQIPPPPPPPPPPVPSCGPLCSDFFKEFDCFIRPKLQEDANRTCKDQYWATFCHFDDGTCISIHLIVRPTRLKCLVSIDVSQLTTLMLPRTITIPSPK